MKNPAAVVPACVTFAPFQKGQVWRIGEVNLAVTDVGKTLVQYKQYRAQPKGKFIMLSSKPELEKYLLSTKAVLISE